MTQKEVREAINNSGNSEWFKSKSSSIDIPHIEVSIQFEDVATLYQYIARQNRGWKKIKRLSPEINISQKNFESVLNSLDTLLTNSTLYKENQLQKQWQFILNQLSELSRQKRLTYDSPVTSFLIEVFANKKEFYAGAHEFLINGSTKNIQDAKYFSGYMLAYEFKTKNEESLFSRTNKEKSSLARLRNDFEKHFIENEKHLNESIEKMRASVDAELILIDTQKEKSNSQYEKWFEDTKSEVNQFFDNTSEKRTGLEDTYSKLLQLKEPAKYWSERESELKKQAWKSTYWLIGLVTFGVISLFTILWLTPEGMLLSFIDNKILAIKWSIIFLTFLSFLAYGIKILAKLSFSSFHLATDAKERYHLTYLYLALNKEGNVNESDRQIVLQSLFSRADTGLLKDDGAPTMPGAGAIVEKVIGKPSK